MKPTKFRKKPVVIEAMQYWTNNEADVIAFVGRDGCYDPIGTKQSLMIRTLEGDHLANLGDFIIKGVKGEFYPCKPDIFVLTYEPAEDSSS